MKKFLFAVALAAFFAAALCIGACSKTEKAEVSLDKQQLSLSVGDEYTFTVQTKNTEKKARLESSDESIVSVDGYTIRAVAAGQADITARAGEAEAVCSVTVSDSGQEDVMPVIQLTYKEAELKTGGELTVRAVLLYDGKETEFSDFTWTEDSQQKVVRVTAEGNSAKITAVGCGKAVVKVEGEYEGKPAESTMNVTVKKDVSVEISNLEQQEGKYVVDLVNNDALGGTVSFTPQTEVYVDGTLKEDAVTELRLDQVTPEGAVSLSDGTVTAVKAGQAILEAVYTDEDEAEYVQQILVRVSVPETVLDETLDLETYVGSFVFSQSDLGTVTAVKLGGEVLSFEQGEEQVTVTGFDSLGYGKYLLEVESERMKYTAEANVVTMVIDSKEDLDAFGAVAKQPDAAVWDGYFVLGADIEYNDTFTTFCGNDQGGTWGGTTGFAGTFDGRGHIIKGFRTAGAFGGLIGTIATTGVVKNVGFVDCEIADSADRSGIVASFVYGKIENVFIKGVHKGAWWCGGVAEYAYTGSVIRNCFVYFTQTNGREDALALVAFTQDNVTIENCYAVSDLELYRAGGDTPVAGEETQDKRNFASWTDVIGASLDLSGFDADLWETQSGIPLFRSYEKYVDVGNAIGNDNSSEVTGSMTIQGNAEFSYSLKDAPQGVVLKGGVVTVEGVFGGTFTLVAKHLVFDVQTEKTFTIADRPSQSMEEHVDIDLTSENFTLSVEENVLSVALGTQTLTFRQEGNVITVTGYDGAQTGEAQLKVETEQSVFLYSATVADKVISSVEDWAEVSAKYQNNVLTGYYVLADDLDYTGLSSPSLCGHEFGAVTGFRGTFDGRGYAIKGLSYSTGMSGFFGTIGMDGVVKNVAFVDCETLPGESQGGIVANLVYGTVENVYISVANTGSWWTGGLAYYVGEMAKITHCFVVVTQGEYVELKSALAVAVVDGASIDNCYTIGNQVVMHTGGDAHTPFTETDTLRNFATEEAMKEAAPDLSGWDTEVWDVSSGVPVFRFSASVNVTESV